MGLTVITPPAAFPVSRAEAKLHCRIDGGEEDTLIDGLIAAAADYVSQYTGRSLGVQTLKLTAERFSDPVTLPRGPVEAINEVTYYYGGTSHTLSASSYLLDENALFRVVGYSWPETDTRPDAVSIEYSAGHSPTPAAIKQAMLLLVGDWYRGRENTILGSSQPVEMPHAVTALLSNYRAFGI